MKRKFVAIVAAFALCFSMVPATAFAATPIDVVEVTVEIPKAGAANGPVAVSSKYPDRYIVTANPDYWQDGGGYEATEFRSGNEYAALFTVTPNSGYELTSSTTVKVNGSTEGVSLVGDLLTPAKQFDLKIHPQVLGAITSIPLSGVPTCVAGDSAQGYSYTADSRYSVTGTWYRFDSGSYVSMSSSEQFVQNDIYELRLTVDPKDGYLLSPDCSLKVNDSEVSWYPDELGGTASIYTSLASNLIHEIRIPSSSLPKAVVGESLPGADFSVAVSAEDAAKYRVSGYWYYIDEHNVQQRTGTFKNGEVYYLALNITPKAGYALAESLDVYAGESRHWLNTSDPAYAYVELRTSFATQIGEVELLNLPTASVGATLQAGGFEVSVPDGANYVAEAKWQVYNADRRDWDDVDAASGTNVVKDGESYRIEVTINAKRGFEFIELLPVKAYGAKQILHTNYDVTWLAEEFSFRDIIREAYVTGVEKPVAGATPSTAQLSVPDGVGYEIASAEWIDAHSGIVPSTFEKGHDYFLQINLKAKDGYEFSSGLRVWLDGEELLAHADMTNAQVGKTYSLRELVSEVRLDNVPKMKIGQPAVSGASVPSGANYSIAHASWMVWSDAAGAYEPFDGVFERGKAYCFRVEVAPEAGYRFSEEDTAFYVNGALSSSAVISPDWLSCNMEYAEGLKTINRVEFKVDEPIAGQQTNIAPSISIVGESGFKVVEQTCMWLAIGSQGQPIGPLANGYFEADETYGVHFQIQAEPGYVFSEDLEIVVNGIILPDEMVSSGLKARAVSYVFGMEGEPAGGTGGLAQSGDDTSHAVMVGLSVGLISGIIGLVARRRARK